MKSTEKTIDVIRGENSWLCRFNNDPETVELFGTDTIPAAFTLAAPVATVVNEIRRLNPGIPVNHVPVGWDKV